jgi:nitrite reductase/ring-hydroxylating ferredoxin subunit
MLQEGRYIVCAAHGASFGLVSGECAGGPCNNGDALERIAIEVRDGIIRVA